MFDFLFSPTASIGTATATTPNAPRSDEITVNNLRSDDRNSVSGDQVSHSGEPAVNDPQLDNRNNVSGNQAAHSGEPAVNDPQLDDQNSVSSGQVSNLPRSRYHGIQSTWTPKADLKMRAHAYWHLDQKIDVSLDIRWAPQHAFIKLCKKLPIETAFGTSGGHRNVYIFIYPERIHELLFTAKPQNMPFGHSTIAFTFYLNRPPALIRPKPHIVFTQKAENAIHSLQSLVQQSSFTIYASLESRKISNQQLQKFCENFTGHKIATIKSQADWTNLYQGGSDEAEIIEGDCMLEPLINRDDAAASTLPAYQEIAPSILTSSTKGKRSCDESSAIGQNIQDTDAKLAADQRKLEEMFSAHESKLREMLNTHMRVVKKMHSDNERKLQEMLNNHMRGVEAVENGLEDRVDKMIGEGMEDVKETVMEQLSLMPMQATITFPNHLY